jgi:uncharacterized protein (DUF1800 family)
MQRRTIAVLSLVLISFSFSLYAKKKAHPQADALPAIPQMTADQKTLHALDRLTFGPRPGDLEAVNQKGLSQWIDQQLHPETIVENPALEAKLARLATLGMSTADLVARFPPGQINGERQAIGQELAQGKILRAIYSNRQLEEVLTDFWYNHFNVFLDKGADRYMVTQYEREVIRPHILGHFKDLLLATAESPAMLFYLDNWQSVGPGARPNARLQRGLNENYGRELMELHTLGVEGGYTQQDVTEVARCFTGWTIREPRRLATFEFNQRLHDTGEKHVLGVTIHAGGGMEDGLQVIDILAHSPVTARFISKNLATRFVSDDPPESLVQRMARRFLETDGDLREVMRAMIDSPEFWNPANFRSSLKSPLELVASAVRAVNGDIDDGSALVGLMNQLGEPLYRKLEPTGYSNRSTEWMNSASLLARMNFAMALSQSKIPGVKIDVAQFTGDASLIERRLLFTDVSAEAQAAIQAGTASGEENGAMIAGLTLGSPDFQRK